MILDCGNETDKRTVEITIPYGKTIALTLSGGADTALLAYLVCKELIETGRDPLTVIKYIITIPKKDGAELYPPDIIKWIETSLNTKLPPMTLVRIPKLLSMWHGTQVWSSVLHVLDNLNPDIIYMADQRAAPDWANIAEARPVRSSTVEGPMPDRVFFPFNHLYKSHTIDLFYRLGIEELLELTHSCTQKVVGRCNRCYHCLERQWGFEQMNKVDPGNA